MPHDPSGFALLLIAPTRGCTSGHPHALRELADAFEHAAVDGRRGDAEAFRADLRTTTALVSAVVERLARGDLTLDANLGPQIWLVNSEFKIGPALWSNERGLPFTLNLNTATEVELMTIHGVDLATAREIVAARRVHGFFRSIDELRSTVADALVQTVSHMAQEVAKLPAFSRQ